MVKSLSQKIKKIKYHITEKGFSVMLFDHNYGKNGKVVYGQIHDIEIVNGVKESVIIKFEERGHEYFMMLPLFSNEYELIKIIKLKSMNLEEDITLAQLFVKTLDIGDRLNFIVSEYNGKSSYIIKNHKVTLNTLSVKNFKITSDNKYTKGRYACTNAYGLCATRSWISFIAFSYADNIDMHKAQDYFHEALIDCDNVDNSNIIFQNKEYIKSKNKVNNAMRDYNSKVIFEYLDKIIPEEEICVS